MHPEQHQRGLQRGLQKVLAKYADAAARLESELHSVELKNVLNLANSELRIRCLVVSII